MADFYKKAQAELESCKTALDANSSSLSDQPVLDGDLITMAIKFERLVLNCQKILLSSCTRNLHCKLFKVSQYFLVGH